jgi:hypothetical protein
MSDEVIQRWDAFLDKTKTRASDLLAEAGGACGQTIATGECDPNVVLAGWEAVAHRTSDLANRLMETWDGQVLGAMERASIAGERLRAEHAKAGALERWIELEIERTVLAIRCQMARETLVREAAEDRGEQPCTQCGAPLDAPIVFITTNLTCRHCRAIGEYVPGTRTRMLGGHCMVDLPGLATWAEHVVAKEAERAGGRAHEAALLVHTRKFLTTRVALLPEQVETFEAELRRTCPFYRGPVVVPRAEPLAGMADLRARMKNVLDDGFGLVSAPMTSLTSSIYENARAALTHYGTVKSDVGQMACTVCGAPRIKDDRNVGPCVYCGGALA